MRWVAFLRAINVGGRRVTGDELVELFVGMGFTDVSTFLASGNVLFTAVDPDPEVISVGLERGLGYAVPTILRSSHTLAEIADGEPFSPDQLASTAGNLQVMLLASRLTNQARDVAFEDTPFDDRLTATENEIFWLPTEGISTSLLNLRGIEKIVGPMTIRTHNTIVRLAKRL